MPTPPSLPSNTRKGLPATALATLSTTPPATLEQPIQVVARQVAAGAEQVRGQVATGAHQMGQVIVEQAQQVPNR